MRKELDFAAGAGIGGDDAASMLLLYCFIAAIGSVPCMLHRNMISEPLLHMSF